MKVPFLDLHAQYKEIEKEVQVSFKRILEKSDFILGEDEKLFEQGFAGYCGRKFGIGVNSGTDALILSLLSLGIGPGDEVIVPVFTFIATASSVSLTGARPVFIDVEEKTLNIDINRIERAVTKRTKAIIPVHLFGQPADMVPILKIARKYNLKVIEDAAQAHGADYSGGRVWGVGCRVKKAGSMGDIGCFSFYPTKNLGGCGDGGMVVLDDERLYKKLLMLRDNGRKSKYEHTIIGYNSRLDTLQAAILKSKLRHLDTWNNLRRNNAKVYNGLLKNVKGVITPYQAPYAGHVYHIYAIRVKNRESMVTHLKKQGVGVMVHYPIPLHLQKAYKSQVYKKGDFPAAERIAREILSLPMHPFLKHSQIEYVVSQIKRRLYAE